MKKKRVASRMILGVFLGLFGVGTCKKERTQSGGTASQYPPPFSFFQFLEIKIPPREAIQIYIYICKYPQFYI